MNNYIQEPNLVIFGHLLVIISLGLMAFSIMGKQMGYPPTKMMIKDRLVAMVIAIMLSLIAYTLIKGI